MATLDYSENFHHFEGEHASQGNILLTLVKRTNRFGAICFFFNILKISNFPFN